jgi:endonuclease G
MKHLSYLHKIGLFLALAFITTLSGFSQSQNPQLINLNYQRDCIIKAKDSIDNLIEKVKLDDVISRIHQFALPHLEKNETLICHSAMCMVYAPKYKLAKWVVHVITPDIINGRVSRTNDFRIDPMIPNTGNDSDYFSKTLSKDNKFIYKSYGFDRGHLAPSADFRWSSTALSESYYFSNITPQSPELNREKWAEIEGFLRGYVYNNPQSYLYVVTAPVLKDSLPKVLLGAHQLPIPEYHYKIAVDYERKMGIAFIVPQHNLAYPIDSYAVTIDSIEKITGINFFESLTAEDEKKIESTFDFSKWVSEKQKKDATPLTSSELPKDAYNTVEVAQFLDYPKEVKICGTVVSTHKSAKGNIFVNLDKSFPNSIFSFTIWAKDVVNFDYQPELFLVDKKVCVIGKIKEYNGIPTTYISNQKKIQLID